MVLVGDEVLWQFGAAGGSGVSSELGGIELDIDPVAGPWIDDETPYRLTRPSCSSITSLDRATSCLPASGSAWLVSDTTTCIFIANDAHHVVVEIR